MQKFVPIFSTWIHPSWWVFFYCCFVCLKLKNSCFLHSQKIFSPIFFFCVFNCTQSEDKQIIKNQRATRVLNKYTSSTGNHTEITDEWNAKKGSLSSQLIFVNYQKWARFDINFNYTQGHMVFITRRRNWRENLCVAIKKFFRRDFCWRRILSMVALCRSLCGWVGPLFVSFGLRAVHISP